jgi:hypothetical protein
VQTAKLLFQLFVRRGGHETLAAAIDLPRYCLTPQFTRPDSAYVRASQAKNNAISIGY